MESAQAEVLGVRLSWAAVSDPGLVRRMNEDSILAESGIYVVADGMGGHAAGEVASGITVETLRHLTAIEAPAVAPGVPAALDSANRTIQEAAGPGRVIGSTVTGLVLSAIGERPTWLVWNIGDSRCYRVIGAEFEQITTDHTVVAELIASGDLTTQQAVHHPDRHVITRALGADESVQADYWLLAPIPRERFLLCSDGLTNEVSDDEIHRALAESESPSSAAIGLLALALERGGRDNVSVVVVFGAPEESSTTAAVLDSDLEVTRPRPVQRDRTPEGVSHEESVVDSPLAQRARNLISEVPL